MKIIVLLVFGIIYVFYQAYVAMLGWNWFVINIIEVKEISFVLSLGLIYLLSVIRKKTSLTDHDLVKNMPISKVLEIVFGELIYLGLAHLTLYITHLFV